MSGQLHGVTVTSVHLTVLASSIPVSHLTLPQLCGYNPASHLPVLCAHKGLRAQLASGATWIQSCSLQAKLNNPTHNRWNFVFLLFLYTHPSLLLSICAVQTGSSWHHCIYQNSHRNSLDTLSQNENVPHKEWPTLLTFWNTKDGFFWGCFVGGPPATRPRWECGHYKVTVEQGWLHLTWQSHTQICKSDWVPRN